MAGMAIVAAATAIGYILGLLLIGAGIAILATDLGTNIAANMNDMAEAQIELPVIPYLGPLLLVGGLVLTGLSHPWAKLGKAGRAKLDAAIAEGMDWVVKLAELILLAAVFRLAANKMQHWSVQVLAFLIFGCLAIHSMKPIARLVIRPIILAQPQKQWVGPTVGFVLFLLVLIASWTVIIFLSLGLQRFLDTGIAGI
jgi:hypothetical protein